MRLDQILRFPNLPRPVAVIMAVSLLVFVFILPLFGIWVHVGSVSHYLTFPPSTTAGDHAPFSWIAFVLIAVVECLLFGFILRMIFRALLKAKELCPGQAREHKQFPRWGWPALILLGITWTLAWSRFEFMGAMQRHTFFPLWLAFVLVINAFCEYQQKGSAPMLRRPRWFLSLFFISAVFWWVFEYLNAFTENWHYSGVDPSRTVAYFVSATLPFSTVLPAVMSVCCLLLTFDKLNEGLQQGPHLLIPRPKAIAASTFVAACVALMLLGIFPNFLFPALWMAPLVLLASLQTLAGYKNVFSPLTYGDWRTVVVPAVAGLACGFCWELWNTYSLARWAYSIPFVERFYFFAMPVEGYAGYIPFGLECLVISQLAYCVLYPGE